MNCDSPCCPCPGSAIPPATGQAAFPCDALHRLSRFDSFLENSWQRFLFEYTYSDKDQADYLDGYFDALQFVIKWFGRCFPGKYLVDSCPFVPDCLSVVEEVPF